MPAIITDQFRILNAETFINSFVGVGTTANYYYSFIGHPSPQVLYNQVADYGTSDWNTRIPEPKDSFKEENLYHDSMLFLKKITSDDVRRVIPRYNWQSGSTYEMYKNNYDIYNATSQLNAKTLYEGKYIVVNSEYKVYLCISNGTDPENINGKKSLAEPNFDGIYPATATVNAQDGYLWKYLFTISPADVVKFVTDEYIPLPKEWGDSNTSTVRDAAVSGRLETIVITNRGTSYEITGGNDTPVANETIVLPVYGDGTGGQVELTVANGEVKDAEITASGKDYTKAYVQIENLTQGLNQWNGVRVDCTASGTPATFDIPIPPKGGHGADIYRECGGHRVMVYSKYDTDPDYVTGNNFTRIGIVKNPTVYNNKVERFTQSTGTALGALKISDASGTANYPSNKLIKQTVGVGSTAVGYVASYSSITKVLRYYQPVGLTTNPYADNKLLDFTSTTGEVTVTDGTSKDLDTTFGTASIPKGSEEIGGKLYQYGQQFVGGIAPPDVEKYSGEIIYIDNRAPITRSDSQKEELKIVVEF